MIENIRPAIAADVRVVKAVTDAAYHPYIARIGVVPAPMEADHAADATAGRMFVVGNPVRGVIVLLPQDDHLLLESVAVHPEAHGKGLGRALLGFAESRARELGLPEIRLYTNALMTENQTLYPRYGYELEGRRVDGPYDRLHYRKRLPS
ncbi:GNAT family N-acetyltransferase [Streptomyces sp. NPDC005963]|uniref:GNAT family N-acetyltransferase n=1 Tax=Streptomyces sp. NPDC005963 TaxID=3156721 RepID=UPI0033C62666